MHVRDAEVCIDESPDGAMCEHTLTRAPRDMDQKTWEMERYGSLCTRPDGYAALKEAIETMCALPAVHCVYDQK